MTRLSFTLGLFFLASCTQDPSSSYQEGRNLVICFGDSLTEGYGLQPEQSYPSLLQNKLREINPNLKVINAGESGDTTGDGLARLPKVLESYPAETIHLFILALGANDALKKRGIQESRKNLEAMLSLLKSKNIPVLLVGYEVRRFGFNVHSKLSPLYVELAEKYDLRLVSNMLDGVALKPELNLSDNLHPNAEGTKLVLENIWEEAEAFF